MIVEPEVDDFLEHFGIKGMKWGIRHPAKKGDFAKRSGKQKTALVGGGVAGYYGVASVLARVFGKTAAGRVKAPFTQVAISTAGAVAGARLTRNFLDRDGKKPASSLPKIKKPAKPPKPTKSAEEIKKRRIKIAAGAAFAVGVVATGLILRSHGNVVAKNLKIQHPEFVQDHMRVQGKLKDRMSELRKLARQTPKGHPSHEGAVEEIKNLRSFQAAKFARMTSKYGVDAKTFKKMKLRSMI